MRSLEKYRKKKPMLFRYTQMFFCELFGTFILVFVGCMGCVTHIGGVEKSHMEKSSAFGYAILIAVHIFAPISGAHLNPVVSLAAIILSKKSMQEMVIYMIAQFIGATVAYAFLLLITPYKFVHNENEKWIPNVCVPVIHEDVGIVRAFFVEFITTFILILVCGSAWDNRNMYKTDSISIRFGFTIAALCLATGEYTSAQMNPARSFGPAILSWQWKHHWLFWLAPILGGSFAALIYRLLFTFMAEEEV